MGLGAVGQQRAGLLARQAGRLPPGAAQRHFEPVRVQLDGLLGGGRGGAPQGGVALVAHFLDLRAPFGVRGEGGRRGLGGEREEEAVGDC